MNTNKIRMLMGSAVTVLYLLTISACRGSGDAGSSTAETATQWTLSVSAPVDHLDVVAREPMIVEHPDGTLFVSGFGAPRMGQQQTNEPTLWKSRDGGTTWTRVNVGTEGEGAAGNSDVDLAVSSDGTLYFVNLLFDEKKREGRQVNIGVSKDAGATWTWTRLSDTRFDDRPWIKVAPDGTAHAIWNDGAGVCYAVSQDRGLTWTERDRIHPQGGSSHLAVGPNGELAARVIPYSASANKYDEGVDLIAVSTDGGLTWRKHEAPGYREWSSLSEPSVFPRWVEPLAWDARGALYSFWTNMSGIWLARSADQGATWTTWHLAEDGDKAFYPYLVARGNGQLAATWFSHRGQTDTLRAHVARIDLEEGDAPPRMAESRPFELDCFWPGRSPDDPPVRGTGGEYIAALFLKKGGLVFVSAIENTRENRFGFSFWKLEERGGEEAKGAWGKDQVTFEPARSEKVYSETPSVWYEAVGGAASISSDGKWGLYFSPYMRVIRLIDIAAGRLDAERLTAGVDRVFNAAFIPGERLARLGEHGGQRGWFLPGPEGLRLSSMPNDAIPRWSPDGSAVAYFRRSQPEKGLFVGDERSQKQYAVDGRITGFAWSADGRLICASAWQENGLTSLVRLDLEAGAFETLFKDLDAPPMAGDLSFSRDGRHLYLALASTRPPSAEARHQPYADRDLDIYELDLATGALRVVVQVPGDDFAPCWVDGFLYWTHNDIRESVVVVPSFGGAARVVVDEAEVPYWSPDGRQIGFTYGPWRLADFALNLDAGAVAVDSQARRASEMKPFVTGYHEDFTPAWSPDGKWIAYHSHRSAAPVSSYNAAGSTDDLYLRRASGGPADEIRLTDFGWEDGVADWSPDGRRLVFDSWERGGPQGVSKPWIVTIDPSTGKPVSAERLPLPDPIKNATGESWSPKGDEIAVDERATGNDHILWIVSLDGKRADKLLEYRSQTYGGLDWTPDGKTIVCAALAGERMQIFAVPRSGGAPRQLTDDQANLMHPQVSPDGRWIACTRMDQKKEIRRVKL